VGSKNLTPTRGLSNFLSHGLVLMPKRRAGQVSGQRVAARSQPPRRWRQGTGEWGCGIQRGVHQTAPDL